MAYLSLSFLGPFQATRAGQPVLGFESNKVRALLAYLVMEADQPHSREELAFLLWPDQPSLTARANLRQALANLRRVIGDEAAQPPLLHIDRDFIQFNHQADYWLDVNAFNVLLREHESHIHRRAETCKHCARGLQRAVDLYDGNFLEHFFVSDSDAFGEWAMSQRENMRHLAKTALYRLADFHERRGDYAVAYPFAVRQIELDPWQEEAYRQMMRALALDGQRSAALAQYETCRRILLRELGAEPEAETQVLAEAIKAGKLLPSNGPPSILRLCNPSSESNPFIGRETELEELGRLLELPACRLVTLTGPGGIGKTRLALQAASVQDGEFTHGIYCVPLIGLESGEFLVSAIAEAVGLSFSSDEDSRRQLLNYLADKEMLLVLDNFEHLLHPQPVPPLASRRASRIEKKPFQVAIGTGMPEWVRGKESPLGVIIDILREAPRVVLFVTSRERLKLQAEWVFDLRGLHFPSSGNQDHLEQFSAVQLFMLHALKARHQFTLSGSEAQAVARICQLVEGLPLAIELAASAVNQRSCAAIAAELENDLQLLVSTIWDIPERHRSVWAAFEYSWRFLSLEEQQSLSRLSVFHGSFDDKAAAEVACSLRPVLSALVDISLLRLEQGGRYSMHGLVQQYAHAKLVQAGQLEASQNNFLEYFLRFAEKAEPALSTSKQRLWLEQLEEDHDNLRAALKWALESKAVILAARLAGALALFWALRGYLAEGQQWLEQVIALLPTGQMDSVILAKVFMGAGMLAFRQRDFLQAAGYMEKGLALYRECGDKNSIAICLEKVSEVRHLLGSERLALELMAEAAVIFRALGV